MVANANLPKGLPTAQEVMEKLALAEAEKASVEARKHAAAEAEKVVCCTSRAVGNYGMPPTIARS